MEAVLTVLAGVFVFIAGLAFLVVLFALIHDGIRTRNFRVGRKRNS